MKIIWTKNGIDSKQKMKFIAAVKKIIKWEREREREGEGERERNRVYTLYWKNIKNR